MKLSTSGLGQHGHDGENKCLNSELWHACAGPLVSLPLSGSRVVYFPQGHSEQVAATTNKEIDGHIPNYPTLAPQLICQLHNISMHADIETDEVYAQMTLQPLTPEEQKDTFVPMELGIPSRQPTNYFCKTLTASDTSTHGGFSVPRRAAEKVFPPLDYTLQPPAQELMARDLHDVEWKFRHIFRGQPKRHLLTTGWSVFVSAKRLVAGDAVIFIRNEKNQLLLGIRRATRPQTAMPSSVLTSDSMHIGLLAAAAHAAATNSCYTIFYHPRASPCEFVIPLSKYIKAVYHTRISVGMRFRMLFETEESSVRRYMGTITGISDLDPVRWPNSHWRSVKVGWDESTAGERQPRVSLWEIEPLTTFPMYPSLFPLRLKRPWPSGPSSLHDNRAELAAGGLPWLRGGGGEQGANSLNFQAVGMFPWMQQPGELTYPGNDHNQQYQALLQHIGGEDPMRQQFIQFQQSGSNISELMLQQQQLQASQQLLPHHLLQSQTQLLTNNLPQLPLQQQMKSQSDEQAHQRDQRLQNSVQMQNGHLQQSEMHLASIMKPDFLSAPLNFSSNSQSMLAQQIAQQSWGDKHAHSQVNSFAESLSVPLVYPGKGASTLAGNSNSNAQNPILLGVHSDSSALLLPTTVPRFAVTSVDADASSMPLTDSGYQNSLNSCMQDSSELLPSTGLLDPLNQTSTFVKVYKSGSVGRSLDISRFSSYHELREELTRMFGIEGKLDDPLRSGWQLVFVDKENDVLLLGDDPWESFVNSVWYIKILSPEDVHKMGDQGQGVGSFSNNSGQA